MDLSAKGVNFPTPPKQQLWGWRVVADPNGNRFGMRQD